ncbi:MAG: hypothetical protein LBE79_07795 [Tannerella sp.]|jgi:fatty acid desaturase|nr:hypothetical protein [Tannerella sp.]
MNPNDQDILKTLFSQLPKETLPPDFRSIMMQRIMNEAASIAKRNQLLHIFALIVATLFTIGLAIAALVYVGIPQINITFPHVSIPTPYLLFGLLVVMLLFADHFFRQFYYKKHAG